MSSGSLALDFVPDFLSDHTSPQQYGTGEVSYLSPSSYEKQGPELGLFSACCLILVTATSPQSSHFLI
jgi:hypothetical protein